MLRKLVTSASALAASTGAAFAAPVVDLTHAQGLAAEPVSIDGAASPSRSNARLDHPVDESGSKDSDAGATAAEALVLGAGADEPSGAGVRSWIRQSGALGWANVDQEGAGLNSSSIDQSDDRQFADVAQRAAAADAEATSSIVQGGGAANAATVRQFAVALVDVGQIDDARSGNVREIAGNLSSTIVQFGSLNMAFVQQADAAKTSTILQSGDDNVAEVSQVGAGAVTSAIKQYVDDNSARVEQFGLELKSDVLQSGLSNAALVLQSGQWKTSGIVQVGDNLVADVTQMSATAAVSRITQSGAFNMAIVRQ